MNVSPFSRSSLLVFITGLHLALLWAVFSIHQSKVEPPKLPSVVMAEMLPVTAPPQPQPKPQPEPVPPKPVRKPDPKPVAKPVPRTPTPAPLPTPNTTPSERAISTPPPAPAEAPPAPAAPPAPPAPAPVSAPRFDAAYLNNPAPPYPRAARRMGEQGRVTLRVHVTPEGLPSEVRLQGSSGSTALDEAALETVRNKWKFVPAKQGGTAVAAWVIVPIDFKLD